MVRALFLNYAMHRTFASLINGSTAVLISVSLDPAISKVTSPLNANVWKVIANEGDELKANDVVTILEAMKLEIAVRADDEIAGAKVEKLLVRPNDVVKAGDPVALVRKRDS